MPFLGGVRQNNDAFNYWHDLKKLWFGGLGGATAAGGGGGFLFALLVVQPATTKASTMGSQRVLLVGLRFAGRLVEVAIK